MNQAEVHKKFIFNTKIDSDWLYTLYEEDYSYIMEVFGNSLETLREEQATLSFAFESNNMDLLRRTSHKIKPVFGFAGLLQYQDQTGIFESACSTAHNTSNLTMQYIELVEVINDGKTIIQEDLKRLTQFMA